MSEGSASPRRWRRLLPFAVVGVLLAATIAVAFATLRYEEGTAADAARESATQAALRLQAAVEFRAAQLSGPHGLYSSSLAVTRNQFELYAVGRPLITGDLERVSWIERVPSAERARWEAENDTAIVEVGWRGRLPAAERVDLFPVTYVTPIDPRGRAAVGVDAGYDATRRDAITASRDDEVGREKVTRPLQVAGFEGPHFQIYEPVYRPGLPTSDVLERREALTGFIVGTFSAEELAEELAADLPAGTALQVSDANRVLIGPANPLAGAAAESVDVGGRAWTVRVGVPGPALALPTTFLVGGLLLTALTGALFLVLGRRERYAFALVERRLAERERAEAALGESEARYQALVEASPEAILVTDAQGAILSWNPGATAMLARDDDALAGQALAELVHPGDRGAYWRRVARAAVSPPPPADVPPAEGEPTELRLVRGDGQEVPVELTAASWMTGEGRLHGAVLRDVSERLRREQETRRQRDYANRLVDSIQDGLVVNAPDGRITQVNDRFCAMVGWSREELLAAASPPPYWPREALGISARATTGLSLTGREPERDVFLRRRSGELFPAIVTAAALRDEHGAAAGVLWTIKDVTARRRADEALRVSEEKFRLLAEYSTDLIARHALDGTILYVSPSCHAMLGYPAEQLVGRTPYEFVHPDDAELVQLAHADLLARHEGTTTSYRWRRRDGTYVWLEQQTRMIRDEATGELLEIHTASRDIGERRRLEDARAGEQRFLEALLDNLSDGVAACDGRGELVVMNRAARALHGLPAVGALSVDDVAAAATLYDDEGAALALLVDCPFGRAFTGESVRDAEVVIARADGSRRTVLVSGEPIRRPDGGASGAVITLHDVTERRDAERALFEARERFQTAFENAPVGIAVVDATPERVGRFLTVNQAFCDILGYPADRLREMGFPDLTHPDDVDDDVAGLMRLISGEIGHYQTEKRYLRADGSTVWARLDASLVRDAAGQPLYTISQVLDISERRALTQMKDEFVAVASHELRTPLTSVLGYLDLVLEGEDWSLSDEQRRYLATAQTSASRLLGLADDLLLVARSDAGRFDAEMGEVDLATVVGGCVEGARPLAEEGGVELDYAADALPIMLGDANRLAQVVDNLLSNALKFTGSGGHVSVRLAPHGAGAALEVSDTGIGIAADEQERLFERFYRTASASRRAIAGTGLGLAITKMIVDAHGGLISVRSQEGAGATFRVELPHPARGRVPDHAGTAPERAPGAAPVASP